MALPDFSKLTSLDSYLDRYCPTLSRKAAQDFRALHNPGVDGIIAFDTKRMPLEPQAHVVTACVRQLQRDKTVFVVGECGTGKTFLGAQIAHTCACEESYPANYRAIAFCPPHLSLKWAREIAITIPGAKIRHLRHISDLQRMRRGDKPKGPEWYVLSETHAKFGPSWKASFDSRRGQVRCPDCGERVWKQTKDGIALVSPEELEQFRTFCDCGAPLWQWESRPSRWPVARFINRKLPGYFDFLIGDEIHQCRSESSARANALGSLCSAVRKVIVMTGTLLGGKADQLRTLLFRTSAESMMASGLSWNDHIEFSERYGRVKTTINSCSKDGQVVAQNGQSNGRVVSRKSIEPGIVPTLFGEHLIDKTVFLSLDEVADDLPVFIEELYPSTMNWQQEQEYSRIESEIESAIRSLAWKGGRRLLGPMVQTLLSYPDYPWDRSPVGYYDMSQAFFDGQSANAANVWHEVVSPNTLDTDIVYPKELDILSYVSSEREQNRQVWVFAVQTNKYDVLARLQRLFIDNGLRCGALRSQTCKPSDREEWIEANGPNYDVIVSHPGVVETGLELFGHGYNFSTLAFYETGSDLYTMRQASRRAWRIGQPNVCKVAYFFYENTMQERLLALMGRKLVASEAIEGKFSEEGMAALSADASSLEVALARALLDKIELDAHREWAKVKSLGKGSYTVSANIPIRSKPTFTETTTSLLG